MKISHWCSVPRDIQQMTIAFHHLIPLTKRFWCWQILPCPLKAGRISRQGSALRSSVKLHAVQMARTKASSENPLPLEQRGQGTSEREFSQDKARREGPGIWPRPSYKGQLQPHWGIAVAAERQDGQNKDGLHGVWEKENLGARLTIKNHQPHKETRKLQFKIHIKKNSSLLFTGKIPKAWGHRKLKG